MIELYRHFSEDGRLLYVGISLCTVVRLGDHSRDSEWFDQIRRIEIEKFCSRREAVIAEGKAISNEAPIYNLVRPQYFNGAVLKCRAEMHPVLAQLAEEIANWGMGLRALEIETGISASTLSRMARNRNTSFEAICLVAAAFGYEIKLSRRIARPR